MIKCPNCGFVHPDPPPKPEIRMNYILTVFGAAFVAVLYIGEKLFKNYPLIGGIASAIAIPLAIAYGIGKYRYDKQVYDKSQGKGEDCG